MNRLQFTIKGIGFATALVAALVLLSMYWLDSPNAQPVKVPAIHGQTDTAVIQKRGEPSWESRFTMDDPLGEFQIELYNVYPPNSPKNSSIQIRECTWQYPRHRLTVWFHKPRSTWIALDTCKYGNNVQF